MRKMPQEIVEALQPFDKGWVARPAFPMDYAPKDGRLLRLLVNYEEPEAQHPLEDELETWTIGHNNLGNTGEDRWEFAGWCWSHDHFTQGSGSVVGWLPYEASLLFYISKSPDEVIEQCAAAAEMQDRTGYEWVRDSLWDNILKRAGAAVRALKGPSS
ncbi:hypothetical protein [Brevundimonas sp.]|uniref:hypothetical protein n=1 Tax=Brevundimonas sp. TaxID=1871086 RepID=UPI00286A7DB2|nr:hypothetical protein [Brevundimonas sp.]